MTKVKHNSGNNEWYTPVEYIELARKVMGAIHLDPASSEKANKTVRAVDYCTKDDSGLDHLWWGSVWLNPPYSRGLINKFINKLCQEWKAKGINQAIVLVNNCTETIWFQKISSISSAICLPKGRIKYIAEDGLSKNSPIQGQVFLYIGNDPKRFCKYFGTIGQVYFVCHQNSTKP